MRKSSIKIGDDQFQVLQPESLKEKRTGYQGYEDSDADGMLFIFERTSKRPFSMKDVSIPLMIAFIRENRHIHEKFYGFPGSNRAFKPSIPIKYVLEAKKGGLIDEKTDLIGKVSLDDGLDGILHESIFPT